MSLNPTRARQHLQHGDLRSLFIEDLGWDHHESGVEITVSDEQISLRGLAQKRGMIAYQYATSAGQSLPAYSQRRKIEHQIAKVAHEHLIVFTDTANHTQIWQWVKRESGKPAACREHTFHTSQQGEALLQKLQAIAFTLEEEERLSLTDVTRRTRAGFDVERVTKRFYDRFQKEHKAFLKFIEGITERTDHEWYASVMLNRLMFVYFVQRKGFLDGDRDYLRNRLKQLREEHGRDKFYSFYRYFLLRLFHEGLGGRKRTIDLEKLVGRIPYLNGGLFDIHELESPDRYGKTIQIPDEAFERIFDYFDQYQWHLDERPLRADNEINPDVLGYIFEKYINQKQMGAYYTKEDITEYICKNTVIPFLFDAARAECKVAFENPKGPTVWDLLKNDPDRYIYSAVRHGNDIPFPASIQDSLRSKTLQNAVSSEPARTVESRMAWNKQAPEAHALATENWREVIDRRSRYEELKRQLTDGVVSSINGLITRNLDIRQFAQDAIENCEGPDLLRAFWHSIQGVTILDPTCGSGAFLFAALNILEPLYEACLDRMEAFIEDLERSSEKHGPEKFSDFRKVLAQVAGHPNRRYFIFKSIILNNLFGVDIMEEAVEICKLRLFLKLAAQVEPDPSRENLGIEPLPDIDFNIRAGNTLVGYATYDEVTKAASSSFDFNHSMAKISSQAAELQQGFDVFREQQVGGDSSFPIEAKKQLRERLKALDDELNRRLATESGVSPADKQAYAKWLRSHQPFHWFVEFHGIMNRGGFDVIIGNPPYVVNTPEKVSYTIQSDRFVTYPCKNLYAIVFERSLNLAHSISSVGLIVQLTALSSEKMKPLQDLLIQRGFLVAPSFPRRPESIFDGVEMPVTILISRSEDKGMFTSRVSRFYTEQRSVALSVLSLTNHTARLQNHRIGKIGSELELGILAKVLTNKLQLESLTTEVSENALYYQEACRYWVKACKGYPFFRRNGESMRPPHGRTAFFQSREACAFAACLITSTLFYWFYSCFSDCEHINDSLLKGFNIPGSWNTADWVSIERRLAQSLKQHSRRKTINTKQGHKIEYDELDASTSKEILDDIDRELAHQYRLTEEELDFIISYDIKYRMGVVMEEEEQ
ncbi:Eco57I restriction-modification methylase [Edaphobacter aggregans]|uniref:site-specific DNA-methyltransferase (adenine-specific) n=1 Tax=Edaphobacter aggregans TaxID=570835 RepID=A0A3R9PCF2_9BACT|nr:DNA methyltransferase [Edaphobacter aggregans]RSL18612.1 Eco57I restriction-modification methylase [Edaphobacter aggregans]